MPFAFCHQVTWWISWPWSTPASTSFCTAPWASNSAPRSRCSFVQNSWTSGCRWRRTRWQLLELNALRWRQSWKTADDSSRRWWWPARPPTSRRWQICSTGGVVVAELCSVACWVSWNAAEGAPPAKEEAWEEVVRRWPATMRWNQRSRPSWWWWTRWAVPRRISCIPPSKLVLWRSNPDSSTYYMPSYPCKKYTSCVRIADNHELCAYFGGKS